MSETSKRNIVLFTDSGCDLSYNFLKDENIGCVDLSFYFETTGVIYKNSELDVADFYNRMLNGEVAKTSAPNPEDFKSAFEDVLKEGKSVLYIGLDSSISTTYNSARVASVELSEIYGENKVMVVDSLCASAGLGLLLVLTNNLIKTGASLKEAYEYAESTKLSIAHRFTVDTLTYLHRGGRVSAASCTAGNLLNIKPVLHVDNEGSLICLLKAHGRKKSIEKLIDAFDETCVDKENGIVFISNAACYEDAKFLSDALKERFNVKDITITDIGPVIGSHSGPGTIALFFIADNR